MWQMYKVFIYDKPVIFCSETDSLQDIVKALVVKDCNSKQLKENFQSFVKSSAYDSLIYHNKTGAGKLFEDFISMFWYLEAAGGIVRNKNKQRLFIFRFGKWDLPKGKIEKSETPLQAALREVTEETGLSNPEISRELPSTYHIYEHKGKKVLKRTYWFAMNYYGSEQPIPQIEEEITEARWFSPDEYETILRNTYASLHSLIEFDLDVN